MFITYIGWLKSTSYNKKIKALSGLTVALGQEAVAFSLIANVSSGARRRISGIVAYVVVMLVRFVFHNLAWLY